MKRLPDLEARHQAIVQEILQSILPAAAKIWVFGSRATGRTKATSDLDLAIDAGRMLTLHETARLAEAFDEAALPYKVDVIDVRAIDAAFRAIIEKDRIGWPAPTSELGHS